MPIVPETQPVQADTNVLTRNRVFMPQRADTSVDSPSLAALPGQEMEQMGNSMTGAGDALVQLATRAQDDANQTRVDDGLNQLRQQALTLTYDPQNGYLAQKGVSALQRDSGMPLADEYAQKLSDVSADLSQNLGNDAQRQMFAQRANDVLANFKGNVEQHTLQEYNRYSLSVQDGAIKLGADDAKQNWSDPVKIDTALASVQAAVVRAGQLTGDSANETLAKMKAATSLVHIGVINAALQNDNPAYASQYLQQYKGQMTADDILRANGVLNRHLDGSIAQQAVTATNNSFAGQFAPTDLDRLNGIVAGMESGGRDSNADGTPVTSPKGALYKMQVEPDTAANPGFGIAPAADNSPAEYNRVGTQYLQALVTKYGNPAQALAAYNAGPGAVDDALSQAAQTGKPWASFLPAETQSYVQNGMAKLGAGQGAAPVPTLNDFMQDAISRLGSNPTQQQVQFTRQAAEQQYNVLVKSRQEQSDQALLKVQQGLISNGGNYNALDYNTKMALASLDPAKVPAALTFAKAIATGQNETDPELYMKLATYPEEMAKLTDAQFMQLRPQLSQSDFDHFAAERGNILNGKTDDTTGGLNSGALKTVLNNRLTSIGINPTPPSKDLQAQAQVGTIQKYVRDDIFAQQAQLGRKMTPAEIENRVDTLFAKDLNFQNTFMGFNTGTSSQNMLSMKIGDVPSSSLDALKASFARSGVMNPTNDQLMRAYWTLKGRNG